MRYAFCSLMNAETWLTVIYLFVIFVFHIEFSHWQFYHIFLLLQYIIDPSDEIQTAFLLLGPILYLYYITRSNCTIIFVVNIENIYGRSYLVYVSKADNTQIPKNMGHLISTEITSDFVHLFLNILCHIIIPCVQKFSFI